MPDLGRKQPEDLETISPDQELTPLPLPPIARFLVSLVILVAARWEDHKVSCLVLFGLAVLLSGLWMWALVYRFNFPPCTGTLQ